MPTGYNAKGVKLWTLRNSHGRKRKYKSGKVLWDACVEYFEWVEANPVKEKKHLTDGGKLTHRIVNHPRPMTIQGLCAHLGISDETWHTYRRDNYPADCELVEQIMYEQKLSGASAGLMSTQLMARYLGLADKSESEDKKAFDFSGLSVAELKEIVSAEK